MSWKRGDFIFAICPDTKEPFIAGVNDLSSFNPLNMLNKSHINL